MEGGRKEGKCREKKKERKERKMQEEEGRKERREGGNISNRMKWHSNVFP